MISTLVQLVGDQTVQNLLPAMALRPSRIVQLRSRDTSQLSHRFETAAANFVLAIEDLRHEPGFEDYRPEIETTVLDDTSPRIPDVRAAISKVIATRPEAVVNVTGATKLMSIGAHQAATAMNVPALYCDTQGKRFVDAETGSPLAKLPTFEDTAEQLSVPLLMAAHGKPFAGWSSERWTGDLLDFGRANFEVRRDHWKDCAPFFDGVRSWFFCERGRLPRSSGALKALIQSPLPSTEVSPALRPVLETAEAAGLIVAKKDRWYLNCRPEQGSVERIGNLMIGTWLELAILDLLDGHPYLRYPLWSVAPKNTRNTDFGEMDIVCVDLRRAALHYISCKSTLAGQALEHLEAVGDRAHRVGGTFAGATLAVFNSHPDQASAIERYAKRLRIESAVGHEEIAASFGKRSI